MIAMTPPSMRPPKLCAAVTLWLLAGQAVAQTPDPGTGRTVFQTNCAICHTIQPNQSKIGPTLFGVVNRPAGQVAGFHYSDANKHSGLTWDPRTLDRYLTAPREVVPGTFMTFPGLKDPALRAAVIAFLETLH